MRAALDDAAMVHHQDLVSVHDGRQPMRDDQRGPVAGDAFELRLDYTFGARVECRSRLVEDKDRRVLQQRSCDRDPCFSPPDSFRPRSPTIVA